MQSKIIIFIFVLTFFSAGVYFVPNFLYSIKNAEPLKQAKASAGGFPFQFGLVNTVEIPCVCTNTACSCNNHRLCSLKPPGDCVQYTVITGQQAGGHGNEIIIDATQYSMSGYKLGDSVIAAGISDALIQLIATPGGCAGCQ